MESRLLRLVAGEVMEAFVGVLGEAHAGEQARGFLSGAAADRATGGRGGGLVFDAGWTRLGGGARADGLPWPLCEPFAADAAGSGARYISS